jgi:flagella basal body P-ring formation protein FlgA
VKAGLVAGSCLALLAGSACAQAPVQIALRPQVRLAGDSVTLGDVATVSSTDLRAVRTLVDLRVGRAPAPGDSAILYRAALAGWVPHRTGLAASTLQWSGPQAAQVIAAAQRVGGDEIAAAAESALRDWLATQSGRSEVELLDAPRDVAAPDGPLRLQPRSLAHMGLHTRMLVWVEIWAGERFVRVVPVAFRVSAWRELATAARPISAGMPLGAGAVELQEVDVAARGTGLAGVGTPGLRSRHALQVGALLRVRDVEAMPAVQRGHWASLFSGQGMVRSEARVEVLQDGRLGQSVRVRQPGAASAVTARVTAPGQLEIEP